MINMSINEDNLTLNYRLAVAMISKDGLYFTSLILKWVCILQIT